MEHREEVAVERLGTDRNRLWKDFLVTSGNATLFHDPDFLTYHPDGRFDTHHLLFLRGGKPLAILPAALERDSAGQRILKSPYGASVGGPVLRSKHSVNDAIQVIAALKRHAATLAVDAIEMRTAPPFYSETLGQTVDFALAAQGFRLTGRWLTHAVRLPSDPRGVIDAYSGRRRGSLRAARRQGVKVRTSCERRREDLPRFYQVLAKNRRRFGATPTHSEAELERLFELVGERLRLFVCELEDEAIGGNLVFELTNRVAYSFYPCHDPAFERYHPALVVNTAVAEHYAERGFSWLDLGPTTFDDYRVNEGLARFKEAVGGIGFCRDAWRFEGPAELPTRIG